MDYNQSMLHFGPDKSTPAPHRDAIYPPFAHIDDTPEDHRRREQMIQQQIVARSIRNPRVLGAMSRVSRHLFVNPDQRAEAYQDQALPIEHQQTISQPYIVALMSDQADIKPRHRVLEIGTGSGYQTAILALLAHEVYTVERIEELSKGAQSVLTGLGFTNIFYRIGDGTSGWPEHAPFDRILVTAASAKAPQSLLDQLSDGGKLIIPLGQSDLQMLTVIERRGDQFHSEKLISCRFVPLIHERSG